ncbi:hypothetical protein AB4Z01_09110 [Inquilinus sp. YAF38]|uniref:hypothetical protein n=1 Tax=Inquilinus sp. YAF38 TaxID=3233084 RepID=UPI003F8FD8EC
MLSRLAEIGMQLAEAAGARALAAQAAEAQPAAAAEAPEAQPQAAAPGLAFARYAHLVRQTLAQRARAVKDLCARGGGRDDRRARHREQVETMISRLIWSDAEDRGRAATLDLQAAQAFADLYADQEDPVEDRPVGSAASGPAIDDLAAPAVAVDIRAGLAVRMRSPMSRRCSTPKASAPP